MEVFFAELLERLPPVALDGPVQRLTSNFINGVNHLPLRWPTA
jgi:cytochrome P450